MAAQNASTHEGTASTTEEDPIDRPLVPDLDVTPRGSAMETKVDEIIIIPVTSAVEDEGEEVKVVEGRPSVYEQDFREWMRQPSLQPKKPPRRRPLFGLRCNEHIHLHHREELPGFSPRKPQPTATLSSGDISESISPLEADKAFHERQREIKLQDEDLESHSRVTVFVTLLVIFIFMAFEVVFFGYIPLGTPDGDFDDKLAYLLIINPGVYIALAVALLLLFFASLQESRPWAHPALIFAVCASVYVTEFGVMALVYGFEATFPLMGVIPFILCLIVTMATVRLLKSHMWHCGCTIFTDRFASFLRIVTSLLFYVVVLAAWVIAYQRGGKGLRAVLPFILTILVFIWKKMILGFADNFPIIVSMLMAGLWIENLDDVFQTMVFPDVSSPGLSFATIGARRVIENIAYVGFLTERWFVFRVGIKAFFHRGCRLKGLNAKELVVATDDPNDHGHGNNRPGYFRRQIQFILLKLVSQIAANLAFLAITPALRFGNNGKFYPIAQENEDGTEYISGEDFAHAMVFALANVIFALVSGAVLWFLLPRMVPNEWREVRRLYSRLRRTHLFYVLVFAILCANELLAVSVVQFHTRIWFAAQNLNEHA